MALEPVGTVDILFVCGGVDVQAAVSPKILAALKRLAERRVPLGALCTGGYALAKAGLLDRYRATIHWENLSALREEFPRIQLSDQLFSIDRDRFTCSGGVAPLDLMLHLVESKLGAHVSQLISEQFIVDRVRSDRDRQYVPLRAQIGVSHESLIKVAQLMEENIEKPLSLDEIASATGLSRRQIERLFKRHLNCVPKRYYLQMRLRRARELLLQTSMPIIDITTACGFQSPPHFSRCYRAQFGCPPSAERQSRAGQGPPAAPAANWSRPEDGARTRGLPYYAACRFAACRGREAAIASDTLPLPSCVKRPREALTRSRAWRFRQWQSKPKANSTYAT